MNKISLEILSNAKAAESTLMREERHALLSGLPPGDPLTGELEKAQAEVGSDLEGLPDSHPLIMEMKAAHARHEQAEASGEEDVAAKEKDVRKVRRAKKLDRASARRERIAKEDAEGQELRSAATEVNLRIGTALSAVRKLFEALDESEGILKKHRMNAARASRLKRILYAFERGISETKMSRV